MKMRALFFAFTVLLAGCSIGRTGKPVTVFDLGIDPPAPHTLSTRDAIALRFNAVPTLVDTGIIWRIGNSASPHLYAHHRWAASPENLVRQRVVDRLSPQGPVLSERVDPHTPQLQVRLLQFEHVFAPDGKTSQGCITLQVVLLDDQQVLGQTRITAQSAATSQDAEGGVNALVQASNDAADQLAKWLAHTRIPTRSSTPATLSRTHKSSL